MPVPAWALMAGAGVGKGLWGLLNDPYKKAKNELEKYYDQARSRATRDVMSQLSKNTRALSARMAAQGMATSGAGVFQPAMQAQAYGSLADINSRLGMEQSQQMAQLAQMRGQQKHEAIGGLFDTAMNAGEMMFANKMFNKPVPGTMDAFRQNPGGFVSSPSASDWMTNQPVPVGESFPQPRELTWPSSSTPRQTPFSLGEMGFIDRFRDRWNQPRPRRGLVPFGGRSDIDYLIEMLGASSSGYSQYNDDPYGGGQ